MTTVAAWRTRMPSRVAAVAYVLVVVNAVELLAVVSQSFFWQDDYVHLLAARQQGLSWPYLIQNYHGHLEPGPLLVYWLLAHLTGTSFVVPTLILVGLSALGGVLLWLVLRETFGERPILLVPLAAYLFTPLNLVGQLWLAAGLEGLPLRVCMLAALYFGLRGQRGSWRWQVAAVAATVVGLFFWEKAVLILPFVLGVHLLVVWSGRPWRERWTRLRAAGWLWGAMTGVTAAYVVAYLALAGGQGESARSGSYAATAGDLVVQVFLPGLVGGPWWVRDAINTVYPSSGWVVAGLVIALFVVVVAASLRASGRRALGPWLVVAGYVAVDIALVLWGRSAYLTLVQRDPRYVLDALPVAAVCLPAAFLAPRVTPAVGGRAAGPGRESGRVGGASLATGLAAAVVVAASCLLTGFQLVPQLDHAYARSYVTTLVQQVRQHPADPVVDTAIPPLVAPIALSQLLSSLGEPAILDQPGLSAFVPDGFGVLAPVQLTFPVLARTGPSAGCGWHVYARPVRIGELRDAPGLGSVVRVGYLSGRRGTLHLAIGSSAQTLTAERGPHDAYFVPSAYPGVLRIWVSGNPAGMCVSDVTVGTVWPGS